MGQQLPRCQPIFTRLAGEGRLFDRAFTVLSKPAAIRDTIALEDLQSDPETNTAHADDPEANLVLAAEGCAAIFEDIFARLPTAIPRRNQPREVQTELLKTVLLHEQGQNTDASVTLLYSESINDNSVLRASISAHANVFDMMGALMLACRGFQGGDIAQKLEYLEIMKILNDEDAATENFLQHEIKSAESSEAARLARYGQTPICFQGQRKTLIDLIATDPAELLAYFAGEMHARWSNGHFPLRRPHPEELGNFPSR